MIKTTKAKTTVIGYTVCLVYQIAVHPSDAAIIYSLKAFFNGAGEILHSKDSVTYRVSNFSDVIDYVIPHFDKFPLQSTKAVSYYLFKAVADLMVKGVHVTLPGYMEVLTYKASCKKGLLAKIFS